MPSIRSTSDRVRWIVDTSAWAGRGVPGIADQIEAILDEEHDSELVLSGVVLLELLRGPLGAGVVAERARLQAAMATLPLDDGVVRGAADAMERLAAHEPDAHRLPVADLLTAALADRHGCGVIHADGDFETLGRHSGLAFEDRKLELPPTTAVEHGTAARQRALKRELARCLHQLPVEDAEALLERAIAEARELADRPSSTGR